MKKIHIVAAVTVALGVIACGTPGPTPTPTPTRTTRPTVTPTRTTPAPTSATPVPSKTTAAPPVSAEQANAARSAQQYLDGQAFSRKGLIAQLKFEGYPVKVATAAVDSLTVDYKAEAAQSAQQYLATQAFSKNGLIAQLKFEGYTDAQARYGVTKAGL